MTATVNGDVHDIGKNIVGIVLQCNNFDVIDMGVMVPCDKILATAKAENADIIGLSGLITPSLDEMVHVAKEMQRQGFDMPLLIGGATTSKAHTAVKIEPAYSNGPTVYVPDASRSVAVATKLISEELCDGFVQERRTEYETIRERNKNRKPKAPPLSYEQAIANRLILDWQNYTPPKPSFLGVRVFEDYDLNELKEYIDWTPFFITWELAGKYPNILEDDIVGEQARALFADAQAMLTDIIEKGWLTAKATIGFWPASTVNHDDIELYKDDSREERLATLHHIRQQVQKPSKKPNLSLADYIAPKSSQTADYIGGFVVTAGLNMESMITEFEQNHDDYNSILLKALADRLAEAFAERMHERVRKEFWSYAPSENLDNTALIKERYAGIRPAPGYPACPEHTEKATLFELLNATESIDVTLSEHFAMLPAASVSGWYLSHPESSYFAIGKIDRDQLTSYAKRKGMSLEEAERWLAPNLL